MLFAFKKGGFMKSKKIIRNVMIGLSVVALVSCGEKQLSRSEAVSELGTIETTTVDTPSKISMKLSTSQSSEINASGAEISAYVTLDISVEDHYFHMDANGTNLYVYEKDSVLYFKIGDALSLTASLDFEKTVKLYTGGKTCTEYIKDFTDTYGLKIVDSLFTEIGKIEGVTESYTSKESGHLAGQVSYTNTNKYETSFEINHYFLTSLVSSVNGEKILDLNLNLDNVKIVIPEN